MYKVLIADDDRLIREDIGSMIDWNASGFRIIGEADHGAEALELAEQLEPELILTDINMPVMDGIELIRRIKQGKPRTKLLVMSNYDDFQYVKDAMKLGATDYVLKYKLEPEALVAILEQLRESIEADQASAMLTAEMEQAQNAARQARLDQFVSRLLAGETLEGELAEQAKSLKLPATGGSWLMLSYSGSAGREELEIAAAGTAEQNESIFVAGTAPGKFAVLLHSAQKSYLLLRQKSHALAERISRAGKQGDGSVVIGEPCGKLAELPALWTRMEDVLGATFYEGLRPIMHASHSKRGSGRPIDETASDRCEAALLHALRAKQADAALDRLRETDSLLREAGMKPDDARGYLFVLYNQMLKTMKASDPGMADKPATAAFARMLDTRAYTLGTYMERMESLLSDYFEAVQDNAYAGYRDEIKKAMAYLERNYGKELSLLEVADHVGLSRNHFCKLFKQETGDNFVNVLNGIRIVHARELLNRPGSRVKEVASQVGLHNYRYFCRIFKGVTGMTPTDYKHAADLPGSPEP